MGNYYICPFCKRRYVARHKAESKQALYAHMETCHKDDLQGLPAAQVYFNFKNKYALTKGNGKSVISGKPTKFNLATEKYERFLPEEKDIYRKMFLDRMRKVYGKDTLLTDPAHQKKMLAGRKISGEYEFRNGETRSYTGSYERDFLEHLDLIYNWDPSDIMSPAPQVFPYNADGRTHFHIPDFYITSLNLIVNCKSDTNQHYRLRDIETEILEDAAIKRSTFNYIKILEKKYAEFDALVEESRRD